MDICSEHIYLAYLTLAVIIWSKEILEEKSDRIWWPNQKEEFFPQNLLFVIKGNFSCKNPFLNYAVREYNVQLNKQGDPIDWWIHVDLQGAVGVKETEPWISNENQ